MRFKHLIAISLLTTSLVAGVALAAAGPKPEDYLESRHGLLQTVRIQYGPLSAYAKGEGDLPADALQRAENIAALANILPVAWGNQDVPKSSTKPDAFAHKEKFLEGFKVLNKEAVKLADAIRAKDAETIKAQIGTVGKVCKGCHDDFKEKD